MPKPYYTQSGTYIRNSEAYARTGAPMYRSKYGNSTNINQPTDIYKLNLILKLNFWNNIGLII